MNRKLTILMTTVNAHGSLNPFIGLSQMLHKAGHRIVFAISESMKGRLEKYGFEEELYEELCLERSPTTNFLTMGLVSDKTTFEKVIGYPKLFLWKLKYFNEETEPNISQIIDKIKPDLIINDAMLSIPCIINSKIPWISLIPSNPLVAFDDERFPPFGSGKMEIDNLRLLCNK